ncbi:MAG: hypothetical protein A2992_06570 [Elusimicrobia bacterium RIFCSPLOWO2_01_FULL_59_12]|nr:MAG: hypothetical protein A2992_06570 [Elusimicrobia bacterium RIFCSPLOWO2_01_FULL_59_12]
MHIIVLGIACLSVQFFAKYAGMNVKKVLYDLVGLGGLFFLLTAASGLDIGGGDTLRHIVGLVGVISPIMGWLCLLGGTLMGVLDLLIHHERLLPH